MAYVACQKTSGDAHVADTDELADVAWVTPEEARVYVRYGFPPVVEEHLVQNGFSDAGH
jgi:8-oxo-dGTP diphosphatase